MVYPTSFYQRAANHVSYYFFLRNLLYLIGGRQRRVTALSARTQIMGDELLRNAPGTAGMRKLPSNRLLAKLLLIQYDMTAAQQRVDDRKVFSLVWFHVVDHQAEAVRERNFFID